MVNTGKPSTGCHSCRKRKVKCDEQQPHCRRCIAINVQCPGYRETNITFFRNQSSWAKEKVRKRINSTPSSTSSASTSSNRETRSSTSPLSATEISPSESSFQIVSFRNAREIPRSPSLDPVVLAIPRFYSDYVTTRGFQPFLDFLPDLYSRTDLDPCLRHALPAVALASSSRQLRDHALTLEAQRRYGQALAALAKAIEDEPRAKSDEVFTAVFLLGMYEIVAKETVTTGVWDTHYQGRLALIRLRGAAQLRSKLGRDMFRVTHHQLFMNSFLGREPPTEDLLEWFIPLVNSTGKQSSILQFARAAYKAASLHGTIAQAVDASRFSKDSSKDRLVELIKEGIAFESALTAGVQDFPRDSNTGWLPMKTRSQKHAKAAHEMYQTLIGISADEDMVLTSILAWNQYRTVRIHLLKILYEASQVVGDVDDLAIPQLQERWKVLSAHTVEDFCATIPRLLGSLNDNGQLEGDLDSGSSYRAYMLLWPLRASIMAIGVSNEQRVWIASLLRCMGTTFGIGLASAIAQLAPPSIGQSSWEQR